MQAPANPLGLAGDWHLLDMNPCNLCRGLQCNPGGDFFDGRALMFYVQRDRQGALVRVEAAPYAEATETLPADNHEIQAWYANDVVETSLKQLKQSDLDMIRVLDDLIQVLTSKGIIRVTDLPAAAQAKLKDRSSARVALGGLNQLINDDETGLI
jgi:hypothetical protein